MSFLAGYLPLWVFYPLRIGVTSLRRGNPLRSFCVMVVKWAEPSHRAAIALTSVRPLDMRAITFEPADSMVMDAVWWLGVQGYEGCISDVWATLCSRSKSVLEIGGNVGLFSVIGGKATTGRYTVVEPVPRVADILRRNLARNSMVQTEVIEGAAIASSQPCTVSISIPREGRGAPVGAYLATSTGSSEVAGRGGSAFAVAGIPFRDLIAGRDLIKIDAEGIERDLLLAVRSTIVATRPTMVIEVLPDAVLLAELLAELAAEAGYSIYVLPAYRLNTPVQVSAADFTSTTPQKYFSKDVVLTIDSL
jgi:FkbM family methyltransferase